ncbi:MAG: tetratricopeptide repeat protein, partial [Bacteroidia bacterium]
MNSSRATHGFFYAMPRRIYILIVILFWSGRLLFSQQRSIDSLVRVALTQKEDTTRITTWLKISSLYNLSGKLDSSNRYMERSYALAGKLHNIRYVIMSLVRKATNLQDNGKVKDADVVARTMLAKRDSARYEAGQAAAYSTLASMSTMQNNFRQAEELYLKAVTIYSRLGMKSKITGLYNSMGWVASGTGDYKKAVNYLLLALESARNDTNARLIGMVNLNLGELYAGLKEYDKALELNKTAYDYYGKSGDIRGQALALGSMANIYGVHNDIKQAISYFNASLALCYKTGYHTGSLVFLPAKNDILLTVFKDVRNSKYKQPDSVFDLLDLPKYGVRLNMLRDSILLNQRRADSLNGIARNSGAVNVLNSAKALYELVNGNYSKSIELYIPSIAGAEAARDNNLLLRDYLNISEAYQKNNDYPKAFAYLKKYLQLSDSIGSDDKKKSVLKSQAEYEFKEKEFQLRSEKEKQKLLFDIEKGKQKTQRIYFVVILVLFAGGLAAVAVGYRRKSKDHS